MWGAHDSMGWWMVFGMVWMAIFWGGVIWLVAWSASRFAARDRHDGESALDIARRRYASGEITREQFELLRRDLS